jgi:hypothetical protein
MELETVLSYVESLSRSISSFVLDPHSMKTPSLLFLVLVGCTSASNTSHFDFTTDTYSLQPGDEKYFCYTTNLPADRDIAITKLTPTYGNGTHHIAFALTLANEPAFAECPVLSRSTWVTLYGGGKDSGPLELPPQVGLLPNARGQQVIMQLHLQNASDVPISARAAMRVEYVDATPDITPSGLYAMDNRKLDIPAHTEGAMNEMSCVAAWDLDVYAVLGHMHKHGVRLELSRGAAAGAEMLYEEKWNFDTQPIAPVNFRVNKGDNLFLRCLHNNAGEMPLEYGESSDTEMCAIAMYYAAPAERQGGCVKL